MKEIMKSVREFLQEIIFEEVNLKKISLRVKGILKSFSEKNIVKSSFKDGKLYVTILFPEDGKKIDCIVQSGLKK